jgi:hypothetical protein
MNTKPLFDINTVNSEPTEALQFSSAVQNAPDELLQLSVRAKELLSNLFDELTPNKHIDFCTAGELSIHQFIQYALTVTGPADVYISSWAIKEDPARVLLFLKETGKIKKLFGVFDYRIKTLDAKHFHLIEKSFNQYALTKCHAKVVVIESETLCLVIVSSANLSNNPRIECGFISTIDKTVQFHKAWMTEVLNGKTVY